MKEAITKGVICLDDEFGITYYLCEIDYIVREDDSYVWKFRPNYNVMELLPVKLFQGIPGLDLTKKKNEYIRENMMPVFISERSPMKNREDLWELLEAVGMDYFDPLEWLLRTKTRYSGDNLYVKSPKNFESEIHIKDISLLGLRSSIISKKLLEYICGGTDIILNDCQINDSNRKVAYSLLAPLYAKEKTYIDKKRKDGMQKAHEQNRFTGRKRMKLDAFKLMEVMDSYKNGKISESEAQKILKISRSTFFRRYKEFLMER